MGAARARSGRRFSTTSPAVPKTKIKMYGCEVVRLTEKYGRMLRPKELLEEARSRRSPVHNYFEWDNGVAAERHRLSQARDLLRVIHVDVVDQSGRRVPARAFLSVTVKERGKPIRAYIQHEDMLNTPYFKAQKIDEALNELETWSRKYMTIRELKTLRDRVRTLVAETRERIIDRPLR